MTSRVGFASVSANTTLVFSFASSTISSSLESKSNDIKSIPNFLRLGPSKLNVPPYTFEEQSILSPDLHIFKTANIFADCPDDTATEDTPPSSKLIFSSKA